MNKDMQTKIAKEFIETVTSPTFDRYSYQGSIFQEESDSPIPNTSVHLIYLGDSTCVVLYDGNRGELTVRSINLWGVILTASYDAEKKSWTLEGVFTEDIYGSSIIHACKVLKRLHEVSLENSKDE